jgi:hypothetical protein
MPLTVMLRAVRRRSIISLSSPANGMLRSLPFLQMLPGIRSVSPSLEILQHLNRLTACGVGYRSFTEQYFDSCGVFKDAVIAIIATVAKQERVRISQRVRAGLDVARPNGRRLGRPKVVVDVARIANLRVAKHHGRIGYWERNGTALARWLAQNGMMIYGH